MAHDNEPLRFELMPTIRTAYVLQPLNSRTGWPTSVDLREWAGRRFIIPYPSWIMVIGRIADGLSQLGI